MDMSFSCRKNAFFHAPIKLAQPFPAPELRTKHFTDTRIFRSFESTITALKVGGFLCWSGKVVFVLGPQRNLGKKKAHK